MQLCTILRKQVHALTRGGWAGWWLGKQHPDFPRRPLQTIFLALSQSLPKLSTPFEQLTCPDPDASQNDPERIWQCDFLWVLAYPHSPPPPPRTFHDVCSHLFVFSRRLMATCTQAVSQAHIGMHTCADNFAHIETHAESYSCEHMYMYMHMYLHIIQMRACVCVCL